MPLRQSAVMHTAPCPQSAGQPYLHGAALPIPPPGASTVLRPARLDCCAAVSDGQLHGRSRVCS